MKRPSDDATYAEWIAYGNRWRTRRERLLEIPVVGTLIKAVGLVVAVAAVNALLLGAVVIAGLALRYIT